MKATEFPLTTKDATPSVTLGVGEHRLKLVVVGEDDVESAPAYMTVYVAPIMGPRIVRLHPAYVTRGRRYDDAVIEGEHLERVVSFQVVRDGKVTNAVEVTSRATATDPATATRLPVTLQVRADAELGSYWLQVGTGWHTASIPFTVMDEHGPDPSGIAPTWASLGAGPVPARISGEHLLGEHKVKFFVSDLFGPLFGPEVEDRWLRAEVRTSHPNHPGHLDVDVDVPVDAPLGRRRVQVTDLSGKAVGRGNVTFDIWPGPVQYAILALGVLAALLHWVERPAAWVIGIGVLYMVLLLGRYGSLRPLWPYHAYLRWALFAFTGLSLVFLPSLFTVGDTWPWGAIKSVEALLLLALAAEQLQATRQTRPNA